MAVKDTRWDKHGSEPTDDYTFFCVSGNAIITLQQAVSYVRELDQQVRE
jgi:hypothetical protein